MTLTRLPKNAFLPRRKLTEEERRTFSERCERVFSYCTLAEKRCIVQLAQWYELHHPAKPQQPEILTTSYLADFHYRYLRPLHPQKPSGLVRAMAKISMLLTRFEWWRGERRGGVFVRYMRRRVVRENDDGLLGVFCFFHALPIEFSSRGPQALKDGVSEAIDVFVAANRLPAAARFAAAIRCARWPTEATGLDGRDTALLVRKKLWPLLLEVAHQDLAAGVRLLDEHWLPGSSSNVFSMLDLHEDPELAYKLAVAFEKDRLAFAVAMLGESIYWASSRLEKLDQVSASSLRKVVDGSCKLLAEWTTSSQGLAPQSSLAALSRLLQFGDPKEGYWRDARQQCLSLLQALSPDEQDKHLRHLAHVVFYAESGSSMATEASDLFKFCLAHRLNSARHELKWEWGVGDMSSAIDIIENKTLSGRNKRVSAAPDHELRDMVEEVLEGALRQLMEEEPSSALRRRVSMTLSLRNEYLVRKHHRVLREEFEGRAREFPVDAGFALKQLIEYCGFSQLDDEMYRKHICQESFDALLPVLERISPSDARVARSGIGWSPRPRDL